MIGVVTRDAPAGAMRAPAAPLGPTAMIIRLIAAGAGGALTGTAVLTGWWAVAVIGTGVVASAVHDIRPARRAMVGTAAGCVHATVTTLWASQFNASAAAALILIQAAGWGLAALAVSMRARWPWPLAPALAISEWARTHWPLGGYPLAQLWLTQADGPLAALAPLLGPFAITAAIVLLATAGIAALQRRRAAIRVLAASLITVGAAQLAPIPSPVAPMEVAAVQGGDRRGVPAMRNDPGPLLERQIDLTRSLDTDVDLVVWPESALAVHGAMTTGDRRLLQELADGFDGVLIAGVVERFDLPDGAGWFRNAAVASDETGTLDRYDKQLPVPFGERVPARRFVELVVDLSLVPRDMVAGSGPPILRTEHADVGIAISYENLFPRVARQAVLQGADILAVPTLASSYVTDEIPTQQLAAARMRARETGRDLAIVGSTGPTALIRADGTLAAQAPTDTPHVAQARLQTRSGTTLYTRYGDALPLAAAALVLSMTARRPAPRPLHAGLPAEPEHLAARRQERRP